VPGGAQQFFQDGGLYRNTDAAIVVWLRGSIDHEYRAVSAGRGVLGLPAGRPSALGRARGCDGCRRADFEHGRIYVEPSLGAHALWGPVLRTYVDEGGTGGRLGWPVTRVKRLADGDRRARFERGTITCGTGGSCRVELT
jgi:uncharacterized protein with LGFP repeats